MSKIESNNSQEQATSSQHSYTVALCILLSRISGLIRELILAYYLGTSHYSDALKAALRIPNFLQNLFGEGVLSASFIPVYSRLRSKNYDRQRIVLAKETGLILLLLASFLVSLGIIFSEQLVEVFTPGFDLETAQITKELLLVLFPGIGLLVLSAWCLSILNSHRYFALSYSAPIIWNWSLILPLLIISMLPFFDNSVTKYNPHQITILCGYLLLIGSALQLFVQLPKTLSLLRGHGFAEKPMYRLGLDTKEVIRNFFPVFLGRGAVQISAYIDTILASYLITGSLSVLMYAQTIFLLPISVFAMAISAAELPALSEAKAKTEELKFQSLVKRLREAEERVLFFTVPTSILFILFGSLLISLVYGFGAFNKDSIALVSTMLACLSIGLVPASLSRLYASSLFAGSLHKVVSRLAILRITIGTALGAVLAFIIMPYLNVPASFYITGLGLGASAGSFVEFFLLKRNVSKMTGLPYSTLKETHLIKIILITSFSLGSMLIIFDLMDPANASAIKKILSLIYFGVSYLLLCVFFKIEESQVLLKKIGLGKIIPRRFIR